MEVLLQLVGIAVFVIPLCLAWRRLATQKSGKTLAAYVALCFAAAFFGLTLIFNERMSEFKMPFVASIKLATEKKADAMIAEVKEELDKKVDTIAKSAKDAQDLAKDVEQKTRQADSKLKEADIKLKQIDDHVDAIMNYSDIAMIGPTGGLRFPGTSTTLGTEIMDILSDTVTETNGLPKFRTDSAAEKKYREVIKKYPRYPYGYLYLCDCLSQRQPFNYSEWKETADKGLAMFEKTTQVPNCNAYADYGKALLKKKIKDYSSRK